MNSVQRVLRTHLAALRMLAVLTLALGVGYPLLVTLIAQVPGLRAPADGSLLHRDGRVTGSRLLGQSFTGPDGRPLARYFQSRPSAAGSGYDPTASGGSNLGPESIVDVLPDPAKKGDQGRPSLLTQVCARSLAVGRLDQVSPARPFCTSSGVGAVLAVFYSRPGYQGTITRVVSVNQECPARPFLDRYRGVRVQCARYGQDYAAGRLVAIRGSAPAEPAVPPDAVTASASGLDPQISPAYALIQVDRVARARRVAPALVRALVRRYTAGRDLGFLGQPRVNVLELNLALDRRYPAAGSPVAGVR